MRAISFDGLRLAVALVLPAILLARALPAPADTLQRASLAGVAQHYSPQDLIGKSVVIVHNLQPVKLMGQESQGMLLAASDENGKLIIISPMSEITSGSVVK